jgi:hypothetical protein
LAEQRIDTSAAEDAIVADPSVKPVIAAVAVETIPSGQASSKETRLQRSNGYRVPKVNLDKARYGMNWWNLRKGDPSTGSDRLPNTNLSCYMTL